MIDAARRSHLPPLLYTSYETAAQAKDAVLHWFIHAHSTSHRDLDVTCVDFTPVVDWWRAASGAEIDSLITSTPVLPPFRTTAVGIAYDNPDVPGRYRVARLLILRADDKKNLALIEVTPNPRAGRLDERHAGIELSQTGHFVRATKFELPMPDHLTRELTLCALAMFHVKNIGLRENTMPRTLRRRIEKHGGYEGPQVYRTLVLRPFTERGEVGKQKMQTAERPLHLVRGHFATYSKERPLFGKYEGTFWRPEHEAGNPSVAVVRKTYVMKP